MEAKYKDINDLIYDALVDNEYTVVDYLKKFPYNIVSIIDRFFEDGLEHREKCIIYIAKKTGKYVNLAFELTLYMQDFQDATKFIKLGANAFDECFSEILKNKYVRKDNIRSINFLLRQKITDYRPLFENEIINFIKIKNLNMDLVDKYFKNHKPNIEIKKFTWIKLLKKGLPLEYFYKNGNNEDIEYVKNIIFLLHLSVNNILNNFLFNDMVSLICSYITL